MWGAWNPTRILPELLMPLCSEFAALFLRHLTGDYLRSFMLMYALVISFFICAYILTLKRLLETSFQFGQYLSGMLSVVFLLLHFLVFRTRTDANHYLFSTANVTCMFYYTIPALLNFILVMWLEMDGWNRANLYQKGFLALLLYLAIFSNLLSSIILASYAALVLAADFIRKPGGRLFSGMRLLYLLILAAWVVSGVFELGGGRADQVGSFGSVFSTAVYTFLQLLDVCIHINKLTVVLLLAAFFILIRFMLRAKREKKLSRAEIAILRFMGSGLITAVYLALLCAVSHVSIRVPNVLIAFWGYVFLAVILVFSQLISRHERLSLVLPFLALVLVFDINTGGRTFRERNYWQLPPETCIAISNEIIGQIVDADKNGLDEIDLYVPKSDGSDNWPLALYGGQRISNALYKHGITNRRIRVNPVPSQEFTDRYLK